MRKEPDEDFLIDASKTMKIIFTTAREAWQKLAGVGLWALCVTGHIVMCAVDPKAVALTFGTSLEYRAKETGVV